MKIYPLLLRIWAALLVSALLNLTALSTNYMLLMAANIANLLCYGVLVHALYRMADESARLLRAFRTQFAALVLIALALVCTLLAGDSLTLLNFLSLLTVAGGIASLLGDYFLYWGLDERILPCGYAFPARRIRWCLYAPVLGSFIGSLFVLTGPLVLTVALQTAGQLVGVWLLWQYMQAVRAREDDPLAY